jgi:hypothetical protein
MASSLSPTLDALGPASGFDFAPVFALAPVRVAGPVSFGGAVNTGRFTTAGSGSFAAQAITAGTSVTVDSGGRADFNGVVTAPTITATSADIGIGANATLGTSATTQTTLNVASNATAITIGGDGTASGYALSNAEAGRIRGRAITVAAQGTQPAVMTVQALTLTGTGAATNGNSFTLRTPGRIRVEGAVAMTGAGAGDTLRLNASQRVEVATDRGGRIGLTSSGDTLAGTLDLTAGSVWVGTSELISQLSQNASFAGRDALLATVSSSPDLVGALAAGRLSVSAQGSFLVQNSGDATQNAGFSSGSGGMTITASGSSALDVVINGRAMDSAGVFQINRNTIDVISFVSGGEGSGPGFTAESTVNACTVGRLCGLDPTEPTDRPIIAIINNVGEIADEAQETIEEQQEAAREAAEKLPQMRISRLIDMSSTIDDVTITDPVTGGGNPSMWMDQQPGGAVIGGGSGGKQ